VPEIEENKSTFKGREVRGSDPELVASI
jgi:hypothetical protein